MNRFFTLLAFVALTAVSCARQESMEDLTARVFERAAAQVKYMDACLEPIAAEKGETVVPRSINPDGTFWVTHKKWWCSGFYPGTLWLVYDYTADETVKALAQKHQAPLEPLRFRTDHHDVGFQLMCSYGNCLRLTGDKEAEAILIDGAHSLSTRFDPEVGCTRSWNSKKWSYSVIVDNMMNLELLLKGSELSGNDTLKNIALTHSRTTMKNHYREDYSSYHLVDYDPETGAVLGKQTVQGYADDSAWARGQAWGLYGYTMVYRFTKEQDILDHAVAIAEYIIPRLPEDYVPFWDFDAPDIPNDVRDASAGSLIASALIELSAYVDAEKAARYLSVAENMLRELASDEYLAQEGEQYGFILRHSTGHKPKNSEVDVPLTYADYYFLEALLRWQVKK
jgi:hypothetical protein